MVSDIVLVAFASGGSAVLASFIGAYYNRQNTKDRIDAENNRRKAEIYAPEKREALSNLHSELEKSRLEYNSPSSETRWEELPEERFEELRERAEDYEKALARASIWLDEQQIEQMREVSIKMSEFRTVIHTIIQRDAEFLDSGAFAEKRMNFLDSVYEARDVLREEFYEPVKEFEVN